MNKLAHKYGEVNSMNSDIELEFKFEDKRQIFNDFFITRIE